MGKEPGSCRIVDIKQKQAVPIGKTALMDHAEFTVLVGYRPAGWISDIKEDGRQRLNGWRLEVRDQRNDGSLLDGHGNPLPEGREPVYLLYEICGLADFNEYDFGNFLGEEPLLATAPKRPGVQITETKSECKLLNGAQTIDAIVHLGSV